jgi:hypothetical protein
VQLQGLSVRAAAAPPAVAPPTPEASETFGPWLRRQVAAAHTAYLAAPKTNKARAWDAYVLMSGVEAEYSQRAAAAPPAVAPPTPEETDPLKWLVARGIWFTDSRGPISQAKYEELRVALMEQVIAIVAAAAPPQGWQPIATAPKDGLLVLLTGENHVVLSGFYGDGRWQQDGTGHTVYGPQFWMPLPAPPEEQP